MIPRLQIESDILRLLAFYPAVGLIGPRQVGKTTLAQSLTAKIERKVRYFDLERLEDINLIRQDPGFFLEQFQNDCVILDEVQRMPELFPELRSLIDRKREPGRFLLLGSASPLLMQETSESLAGRIGYVTMHPLHHSEIVPKVTDLMTHWWRGGFPDALTAPDDMLSSHWRDQFIRTYVERDIRFLGLNADPILFGNFLKMVAATHGNLWNAQSIGNSLGVSGTTIRHWMHFLERSFFVTVLHPYSANLSKRLVKSPKIYISDSGLFHTLLGIRKPGSELVTHPMVGASWEGYAVSQILQSLPMGIEPYFYRTSDGTECDLVLVKGLKPISCIEIKYGNNVTFGKALRNIIATLKTENNFLLTYSSDSYKLAENLSVMNLGSFLKEIEKW